MIKRGVSKQCFFQDWTRTSMVQGVLYAIATKSDSGDLYFDGAIDEVRIYYRALQGEEI
jgi:hypothetical protein